MFTKTTLPDGLRLITVPMDGVSTVTILVMVNTGSNNETREVNGSSHFLEHMFFKGTKRRPHAKIVAEEIDRLGAYSNAFTSHEHTGYHIKVRAEKFPEALDLIADVYSNSLVDPAEVEKERGAIIQEYRMIHDTPQRLIGYLFEELLYGDQPAGWEIAGTPERIQGLTADDLKSYFLRQYSRENTFVVLAGNLAAAGGGAAGAVARAFGNVRSSQPHMRPPVMEEQSRPQIKIQIKETDQTHLILGVRAFGATEEQHRFTASVLAHLLGGSMASRLFEEIREKRGLAYAVATSFDEYTTYGSLATYAGVAHENVAKSISLILVEYQKIRDAAVPEAELARAKESLKGRLAISLEASDDLAFFVGGEEVMTGKPMTTEEVFARIDAVSAEEVQAVARRVFRPEGLNLAMIGPIRDQEPLSRLLADFRSPHQP